MVLPGGTVGRQQVTFSVHNGAHADQPVHVKLDVKPFEVSHYQGKAVVLNVQKRGRNENEIKVKDVEALLRQTNFKTPQPIVRIVLIRTGYIGKDPREMHSKKGFPYLGKGIVPLLKKTYPQLKVIGLDSPSVDAEHETQLAENRHGELFHSGIAPLEGLHFPTDTQVKEGTLYLRFDPLRMGTDAIGVHVFLIS